LGFSVQQPDFWKWSHLVSDGGLVYIINLKLALGLTEFAVESPWNSSGKFARPIGIGAEIIKMTLCEICAGSRAVAKIMSVE
jgi:hypothetical protein